jgi:hypothetical protein
MKKHVYLSGGMEYALNEGRDWREGMHEWIENELGWTLFNPNRESDAFFRRQYPTIDIRALKGESPEKYKAIIEQLVTIDCREIAERSDLVICLWDDSAMRGAGTKGELTIARYFNKPVYMVTTIPSLDIPGWILACTTRIFPSFDALKTFLHTHHH